MSGQEDGGPAFPAVVPLEYDRDQGKDFANFTESGMTLRDYFAAHAPVELGEFSNASFQIVATRAYRWADAMLKARERSI